MPETQRGEAPVAGSGAVRPRILHVLASLTFGGIETWLVHMLRHRQQFDVEHEILLTKDTPGAYEAEVRKMGIPVHRLPLRRNRLAWLLALRRRLIDLGPFDAVHSHVYLFSAPVLTAAQRAGVPVRIAHCHNARSRGSDQSPARRLGRRLAIGWLKRAANRRIGISEAALEEICGPAWREDPAASVLLYGFDFSRAEGARARGAALRAKLAIPNSVPVIGHVGRFIGVKNHELLIRAFAALSPQRRAHLVLVGEGEERARIEALVRELGLGDRVHFPGTTDDVPGYMGLFRLFVLPSISEGLGIVCLEAQAAGTRCLVSDTVPAEVDIVPNVVERLSIALPPAAWAGAMERMLDQPVPDAADGLRRVEQSPFGIARCIRELNDIYLDAIERPA